MANLNRQMLLGRVGGEPTVRVFDGGAKIANVSLAVTEHYKDKTGKDQELTNWFRLRFFGRSAETVEKWVHKGDLLYAEGPNMYREYTDKNGQKVGTWEVKVMNFQMLSYKSDRTQEPVEDLPPADGLDDMPY